MTGSRRCVVVVHDPQDSIGVLPDIAAELDLEPFVVSVEDALPAPSEVDCAIVLGSPESVYDNRLPWLAAEQLWLRALISASLPVFGVCFGSQALARALGGSVHRNHTPEIGWTSVDTADPALLAPGPWLNFHFDAFTVPPRATEIARTALAPQAYIEGRCMGVQFHPEISEEMYEGWQRHWRDSPTGARMLAGLGELPERLRDELRQRGDLNAKMCADLLGAFLERTATVGE
ncbi:type 1 glutamine amidotransferase [Streptomyces ossamyceticus]|uniref:type 1 glutamine amidotransferase n=1 Tax=Streptomyces ossamyceticus TaxID=249581 RepID=UPI0006E1F98B|nr:type 1 glutamine amidotransferase [Streptomyces ossamyceticus]